MGEFLNVAGFIVGVIGLVWAVLAEWHARKLRRHAHSFLKGLKVAVFAEDTPRGAMLKAIDDEMSFLIPPKARAPSGPQI